MTALILNVPEVHSHEMVLSCMYAHIGTFSLNCGSLASPPPLRALASPAVDGLLQDFQNHKASKLHRTQSLCARIQVTLTAEPRSGPSEPISLFPVHSYPAPPSLPTPYNWGVVSRVTKGKGWRW